MTRSFSLAVPVLALLLSLAALGCGSGTSTLVDAGFSGDLIPDLQGDDGTGDAADQVSQDLKEQDGQNPEVIPDGGQDVPVTCDDQGDCQYLLEGGVQCMVAVCSVDGVCELTEAQDATTCDDQNLCTSEDACDGGLCVGKPLGCVPEGPCYSASCNTATGQCENEALPDDSACDDASVCTLNDRCEAGQCTGEALPCDDGIFCTQDLCDPVKGCSNPPAEDGTACEDGDLCTVSDVCMSARCVTGFELTCDDQNPCTRNWCDQALGCSSENLSGGACDDGDKCTGDDVCTEGVCGGATALCACLETLDCAGHEDGDLCNGTYVCLDNKCVLDPGTIKVCDPSGDGACELTQCNPSNGACEKLLLDDSRACDDGNSCTQGDACKAGLCTPASTLSCGDGNSCTADSCIPELGCVNEDLDGDPCDDGNLCTTGDSCGNGTCQGGLNECQCQQNEDCIPFEDGNLCNGTLICTGNACVVKEGTVKTCAPSQNPCTTIACKPATGLCEEANLESGLVCDDADQCTDDDRCINGVCMGAMLACDDGDICTGDSCVAGQGCTHSPLSGGACDDGDACTSGETCNAGNCVGGASVCECLKMEDCAAREDGDLCNGTYRCVANRCEIDPASVVICNNSQDSNCRKNLCTPATGKCSLQDLAAGTPCSDGDLCTLGDACFSGICAGQARDCDDENLCTEDGCDVQTGSCQYESVLGACDDANDCTTKDFCINGQCLGEAVNCDDQELCTLDYCASGQGCQHKPVTKPCDDGSACTLDDLCQEGACKGQADLECADESLCTTDTCDPRTGCLFTFNQVPCDDTNACTQGDACAEGACIPGPALVCNDQNPCTEDSCDELQGCVFVATPGVACTTGSPCLEKGKCVADLCVESAVNCDDLNVCTLDGCDPVLGCMNTKLTGTLCSDGLQCTDGDACLDGACKAGGPLHCDDENVCTQDSCTEGLGCLNDKASLEGLTCEDGNACTEGMTCKAGLCSGGLLVVCDDANPCTTDSCDPVLGCVFEKLSGQGCNDTNACTIGDQCIQGVCVGTPKACKDSDPCTEDRCESATGNCINPPVSDESLTACNDLNACTQTDRCVKGLCTGQNPVNCDDSNVCTADSCDKATGLCNRTAAPGPCDDKNPCTTDDQCAASKCVGGPDLVCNDGNICTDDLCLPEKGGCIFKANTLACEDGNSCTVGDKCSKTFCVSGPSECECQQTADCASKDDGNPCNGTLICQANECVVNPATIIVCPTGSDTTCRSNVCDPADGGCKMTNRNEGQACTDGTECTSNDVCTLGACVGSAVVCADDGNPCTDTSCDKFLGCVTTNNKLPCDDHDLCTSNDVCNAGKCGGTPKNCDDLSACTVDYCVVVGGTPKCVYEYNTDPCNDGNECTINDVCAGGNCKGSVRSCDDFNICTDDSCIPATGCLNTPNTSVCSDGNPCTDKDVCTLGVCAGTAKVCNDLNLCTDDSCVGGSCQFLANTAACNDGSACTDKDFCADGVCKPGLKVVCNDLNDCTNDSCNPASGCVYTPATGAVCNDGEVCTSNDTCSASGKCGGVAVPGCCKEDATCFSSFLCTIGTCDLNNNRCVYSPKNCEDGNDCTLDTCKDGVCGHSVLSQAQVLYYEGFDGATNGWTFTRANESYVASTINWHVTTYRSYSPTRSLVANDASLNNYYMDYGYHADAYAYSPKISLPAGYVGTLSFQFQMDIEATAGWDFLHLYIQDGASLVPIQSWTNYNITWTKHTVDLSAYSGKEIQVVFRFQTLDSSFYNHGTGVDDVTVEVAKKAGCCQYDNNCADANLCELDYCDETFHCFSEKANGSWLTERVDSGSMPAGWFTSPSSSAWAAVAASDRSFSTRYSMYLGGSTATKAIPNAAGSITLTTHQFDLTKAKTPVLTFNAYLGFGINWCQLARLEVAIRFNGGASPVVYSLCDSTNGTFGSYKVPIPSAAGQRVSLVFALRSDLPWTNKGEGVYLDDIRVYDDSELGQGCCQNNSSCTFTQFCAGQNGGGYCVPL